MKNEFKEVMLKAISKYGCDNVDLMTDEIEGFQYGVFHTIHESHPVTDDYPVDTLSKEEAEEFCNDNNIANCIEEAEKSRQGKYYVNWTVAGIIEVDAQDEDDAKEQVCEMTNAVILDYVKDSALNSFELGTIERSDEDGQ